MGYIAHKTKIPINRNKVKCVTGFESRKSQRKNDHQREYRGRDTENPFKLGQFRPEKVAFLNRSRVKKTVGFGIGGECPLLDAKQTLFQW